MAAAPPVRETAPPSARAAGGTGRRGSPLVVDIPGLAYFQRQLKEISPETVEEFKRLNFRIGDLIVQAAQAKGASLGGVAGKAAKALKSARAAGVASISFNSARVPYGAGAEFGSIRHPQFQPWRGNGENAGYFLYPTIRQMSPELLRQYEEGFDAIVRRVFPE